MFMNFRLLVLPNLIYRVSAICLWWRGWYETKKVKLKFIWKYKECKIAKTFLKKTKAGGLALPNNKTVKIS